MLSSVVILINIIDPDDFSVNRFKHGDLGLHVETYTLNFRTSSTYSTDQVCTVQARVP